MLHEARRIVKSHEAAAQVLAVFSRLASSLASFGNSPFGSGSRTSVYTHYTIGLFTDDLRARPSKYSLVTAPAEPFTAEPA
jgi:hypothetical protein